MEVLHIHQDFPDGRPYPSTDAVLNLLDASVKVDRDVSHHVLSINRTSSPFSISFDNFEKGISIVYWALPVNFIYSITMWFWAWFLVHKYKFTQISIVHGHKLTTEGLLARYIAKRLKVPFILSVRGGSDAHNLNRMKTMHSSFRKNLEVASTIFWVSPWFKGNVSSILKINVEEKSLNLPNICKINDLNFDDIPRDNNPYFTVLSFHQYKRKGILPLLEAIMKLKEIGEVIYLDIYGGGPSEIEQEIKDRIAELGLNSQATMKGKVKHEFLLDKMVGYKGLLLPSKNETFGMAYIEALATGNVIMMHKDTGIDGFFRDGTVGVAVKNQDSSTISDGIKQLESCYQEYFDNVKEMKDSNSLDSFTAETVGGSYIENIYRVTSKSSSDLSNEEVKTK